MKNQSRLLVVLGLLLPMSVWAQGAVSKQFLNLYYKSKQLYIGLYSKNCEVGSSSDEGSCVKSYEIKSDQTVRSAFVNAVTEQWVGTPNATKMQSATLNLATDIDFGYTFENGSCSDNFGYLFFSGSVFDGQYHTISNLCSIDDGQTKRNLGLFGQITEKTVRNLNISNVHFTVTSGEPALTSGGDYRPVGALAPKISNSIVTDVKLKNVVIQAPLAGGLAGYIENSTIKGISTVDNSFIKVTNGISITEDYIGKVIYKNGDNVPVFSPYKVLLGGLAGAAYFSNFQNIDIAVQVENNGDVDLSALGGLVGHYVYAPKNGLFPQVSDRNSKISNVKIHGNSSTNAASVKSLISGGTAMGGILGASRRLDENNSPIVDLVISNSSVTKLDIKQSKIKINDVKKTQSLYFGGFVGNSDLCSGGILKVSESTVENVNIEESVENDAPFQYYMGGIAGRASCSHNNNSSNRNDLYLTIQNSTVSGKIKLEGGNSGAGKTSSGVRISAAIGGLVGDAIVSLDEGGISENESNVSIIYKAKRAKNDVDLDSVLVGGFFGGLSLFNSPIDYVRLTNLSYEGSIDIEDDGITARVGGIVGKYPFISRDDAKIEIYDVHVKALSAGSIVSYSGETKASNTSSSIGGICGMCQSPKLISHSSVDGSFMGTFGTENPPQKEFYVGGLVGYSLVKDLMVVKNNYFTKTIADKFNKVEGKGHAGYLFGYLTGDGLGTKPQITSNFHYGADNLGAIGYFKNYGEFANSVYLNDMDKFDAKNNVRNGATEDVNENGNGYVTESYMASKDFAVYLNGPWTEAEDQVWTFANSGYLPTFGTDPVLTYTVRFLDGSDNVLAAGEISYGGSAESLAPEAPKIAGKCFTGWNEPIDKVFKSMDLYPQYEVGACKYTVTFNGLDGTPLKKTVAEDGTELKNPQTVEEGKSAILPKGPDRVGNNCFLKWDDEDVNNDFSNVTHNIVVSAISKACYDVTFYGLDEKPIANAKTKNGQDLDNPQVVDGGSAAIAPADPSPKDGLCFNGWDTDFSVVKGNLDVKPNTKKCTYTVKFYDLRGFVIEGSEQEVLYGDAAVAPTDPPSKDDLCFIGWDTDFSEVKGNLEVKPNTKKCVFTVKFYGLDGTTVIKTQNVQEGLSARAPATPEPLGDLCFDGWDTDFSEVKGDLEVHAQSKDCPASSSSAASSSSVVQSSAASSSSTPIENPSSSSMDPISSSSFQDDNSSSSYDTVSSSSNDILSHGEESSSSSIESSSSSISDYLSSSTPIDDLSSSSAAYSSGVILSYGEEYSSSSFAYSSSSISDYWSSSTPIDDLSSSSFESSSSWNDVEGSSDSSAPQSSSDNTYMKELVKPVVTQDGNAIRMTFNTEDAALPVDLDYHIVVTSNAGIYLDTVVRGKDVESVKNGTWRLDPAPVGEYFVALTLTDGINSVSYDPQRFMTVDTVKQVDIDSSYWQTYSLYAFCHQKGDKCVNDIESLMYSRQDSWAVKQCEQMKEELRESDAEDDYFREQMEQVCRIASQEQGGSITSVFWWDETKPIGDYWQYRRFKVTQNFDSTRGYWYGFANKQTLSLNLQTPNMNDEVVWTLNNNYSGWNLVANPFGWYIKLPQDNEVEFKKWDPKAGECVPVDKLGPYEAIWVHVEQSRELRIPLKAAIILEGEREVLSKRAESEDWNLRVVLADDNGKRDSWNELVAGRKESSLSEPPAGMGDHVNLSIVDGKQRLAKSVKKNSEDLEWNLEASATSSRKGHLSFIGLESVWAKGMHVYATVNDETVEVVNDRPLDVQLAPKSKKVTVRVTKNVVPFSVSKKMLKNLHVNQVQNALNVGFDAATNLAGADVKVSIVELDGRIAATSKSIAKEGSNTILVKKPKSGVYFVHLKVGNHSSIIRTMVR